MTADPAKKLAANRRPEDDRDRLRDEADQWREQDVQGATARHPLRKERFVTHSDLEVPDLLTPADLGDSYQHDLGFPGQFPYTRGVQPTMYRGRLWTMRMFAGFGTPRQTNERFRYLLEQGQTGLSTAFDFPTLMGYDSDSPRSLGEVGMVGVAVDTLHDMEVLFDEIPLDKVTTSMTINGPAAVLLGFYIALADKRGIPRDKIGGTVQNDCLKEFIAQHAWVVPPRPAMRIVTDSIEFCAREVPRWNSVSISGYHIREAGATAVQEAAFTLANGIAYVQAAVDSGLDVDRFGARLSFFFNAHNHLFEEVAKFRAARRMWAKIMRERFGAREDRSCRLRFHTQTAGSTLQSRQIDVNVVRTTMQALAAVLGGTQSLHTNGRDEALALPTEASARLALRTQQVLGYESGVTDVVDPLGGSPYVEQLTDEVEARATALIARIDELGGAVKALDFMRREIERSAYEAQQRLESGRDVAVGVNRFEEDEGADAELFRIDPQEQDRIVADLRELRAGRDQAAVDAALDGLKRACDGTESLLPPILRSVEAYATLGEICQTMESVFGTY